MEKKNNLQRNPDSWNVKHTRKQKCAIQGLVIKRSIVQKLKKCDKIVSNCLKLEYHHRRVDGTVAEYALAKWQTLAEL